MTGMALEIATASVDDVARVMAWPPTKAGTRRTLTVSLSMQ